MTTGKLSVFKIYNKIIKFQVMFHKNIIIKCFNYYYYVLAKINIINMF